MVVEPAGAAGGGRAAGPAAARSRPGRAVLSGGNIDPLLLMRVIRHGMAAAGRYLLLPRAHPRPARRAGAAARRARPSVEANVLDVVHQRTSAQLPLDEVEVALQMEIARRARRRARPAPHAGTTSELTRTALRRLPTSGRWR